MAEPKFFSQEWAAAVRDALAAGPSEQARSLKVQMYWDFFELIRGMYPASWALGCRDLFVIAAADVHVGDPLERQRSLMVSALEQDRER